MRSCVVLFACLACLVVVTPAAAQSTYVGGSLLGEFARFGSVEIDEDYSLRSAASVQEPTRNGETLGFDVRLGRALGERWGVEVAFGRGGTIENRLTRSLGAVVIPPGVPPPGLPFPDFEFELRTELQHSTVDAAAWVRQELGARVELAVFGGVSFTRVDAEQSLHLTDTRLAIYAPFPRQIETVTYGVGPVVGADAIVALGDHLALTAGARLHGVNSGGSGGWLIRPSLGIRWGF